MKVYFVGAGPGAPDLITVRGAELVARCPVVLYAGSLVPRAVVARARADARVLDSAGMTLDAIVAVFAGAHARGEDVARVHTGDPSLFGSIGEQMRRLDALGIGYEVVPGVSSFTAAAAALRRELTLPGVSQTVIIARAAGRTAVPEGQELAALAAHRATLALFLSAQLLDDAVAALVPAYGADCPAAIVHRASWPDEKVVRGRVADLAALARAHGIAATAMVLVGPALAGDAFPGSRLYAADFAHGFRAAGGEG
ncbi:MAG: precorrin-4 C(11)-methyltransferase [Anaeromyxobacteraceae bacterium]